MQRAMTAKAVNRFLYDSHCHLRVVSATDVDASTLAASLTAEEDASCGVSGLVLCGTHPQLDWNQVQAPECKSTAVTAISGFGVHPWFVPHEQQDAKEDSDAAIPTSPTQGDGCCCSSASASAAPSASLTMTLNEIVAELEQRLCTFPRAIVAEIGLDKLRGPPESVQRAAFVAQLRLAAAYQRPVSVHCVRQYGLLLQILQDLPAEDTPPAIIVHAFTGSMEVAKSLLSLKNKKRPLPPAAAAAATEPPLALTNDSSSASAGPAPVPKKTKRGGAAASADTVRIKDRLFFGVGLSTSFTVKHFSTHTLPFLLGAQRVLLETDAHYRAMPGWGSDRSDSMGCTAQACVYVDECEQAAQLRDTLKAVEHAAAESAEFAKAAEAAGAAPDAIAREALAVAYANAFRAVLS